MSILTTFEKDHCFFLQCFFTLLLPTRAQCRLFHVWSQHLAPWPLQSPEDQLSELIPGASAFCPETEGEHFILCLYYVDLIFFFKWPIAVPQPTLSPSVCVGMQHPQEHLLLSWPSLLTPTELSPLS